uniref:Uncharacterized protein n=1 Tax=Triticum urartu TaxID=4572 RepID=A0A8R7QY26_TRIUA
PHTTTYLLSLRLLRPFLPPPSPSRFAFPHHPDLLNHYLPADPFFAPPPSPPHTPSSCTTSLTASPCSSSRPAWPPRNRRAASTPTRPRSPAAGRSSGRWRRSHTAGAGRSSGRRSSPPPTTTDSTASGGGRPSPRAAPEARPRPSGAPRSRAKARSSHGHMPTPGRRTSPPPTTTRMSWRSRSVGWRSPRRSRPSPRTRRLTRRRSRRGRASRSRRSPRTTPPAATPSARPLPWGTARGRPRSCRRRMPRCSSR